MMIGVVKGLSRALLAAAALITVQGAALAQSAQGEPVKIGALLSVTGGIAGVGIPERDGVLLAAKIVNERGGIDGRPIEVILEDDGSNPDAAIPKINRLIHEEKVKAVVGPSGIAQAVAVGAIAHPLKVPMLAFSGLGPAVEKERTCVFHLTPAQELNARALLSYARHIGAKNIGVLHDSGYGQVIWNAMKGLDGEYGVTFSRVEKFEIAATDATAQAASIRSIGPDAVIVLSTSAVPFRNLKQVKVEVPIISVHGTATYEYVKAMGDAADNIVHAEFLISEDPLPNQKEFVEIFQKEYGRLPKHFDAAGWDAITHLAQSLGKAGLDASNEELCAALRQPYDGVMTRFDFSQPDMGGLTLSSFTYSKLENGVFKRLDFKAGE